MRVWSLSTTVRSPERLLMFLKAFDEVNNGTCVWDEHRKRRLYAQLVCSRVINPHHKNMPVLLQAKLRKPDYQLTLDDVWQIFDYKSPHGIGPSVGGILSHLRRWGMIEDIPGTAPKFNGSHAYQITKQGQALLLGTLSFREHMQRALLAWKFPTDEAYKVINVEQRPIRPYVATLALIMEVNRLCRNQGTESVGMWRDEFDLFALTLMDSEKIGYHAECVMQYRADVSENHHKTEDQKDDDYNHIINALEQAGYCGVRSAPDYSDVIFRYFRLSNYFEFPDGWDRINVNMDYEKEIKSAIRFFLH